MEAVLDLVDYVARASQAKEHAMAIFCDLTKAFDTIDRNRLINELERYGITGRALMLVRSYLSDRRQIFVSEGKASQIDDIH